MLLIRNTEWARDFFADVGQYSYMDKATLDRDVRPVRSAVRGLCVERGGGGAAPHLIPLLRAAGAFAFSYACRLSAWSLPCAPMRKVHQL